MYKALGIIHPVAQFLSSYGSLKLRNQWSTPKIQQCNKYKIKVKAFPFKSKKMGRKKESI